MRVSAIGIAISALITLAAVPAVAHQVKLGDLLIVHPRAVALVPGRPVVVYMTVINRSDKPDRLIAASSPLAKKAELHLHVMAGDVASMQTVEAVDVPAHGRVDFKPGGYHIMLFGITLALKAGERIPLRLGFAKAGGVDLEAVVGKPGDAGMDMSGDNMHTPSQ